MKVEIPLEENQRNMLETLAKRDKVTPEEWITKQIKRIIGDEQRKREVYM